MKRLWILILLLLLTACTQEITEDVGVMPLTPPPTLPPATETLAPTLEPTAVIPTATLQILPRAQALPAGPISMVAIGDSLTLGDGDESGKGYPGRLLDKVITDRPGSTVTNFGQSGWNSDALINGDQGIMSQLFRAQMEVETAVSQGRGVIVFVWIGSNDLWYLYEYGGDVSPEQEQQDAEHFASNLDLILVPLREAGAQMVIALLDDQSKRPVALRGEAFTAITSSELSQMSVQVERYNQAITSKAEQYGALTVDFYNTTIFTDPATLSDDGNHPNQAGYDLIAEKWYEIIATLLLPG